ncbi:MAG: phosphate-starvation-inducible PsiE family protein [Cyanobacteriota bacterium]|nr:phosphate-starvation-inducible PsiE family protein [Cyanobacteriota bacterium]
MPRTPRWLGDSAYLRFLHQAERQLAKLLGLLLLIVMVVASTQLVVSVVESLFIPGVTWYGERLVRLLGDLLTLLIAIEVLQNITSYLRQQAVQIELVLLTAMTAVARKVIVLPSGAENKPLLLAGLGMAVLFLALAYVLIRLPVSQPHSGGTEPTRSSLESHPSPPADGGDEP